MSLSLLITREWIGRLSPNFQGSSRTTGEGLRHKKFGVTGGRPENSLFGIGVGSLKVLGCRRGRRGLEESG